MEKEYLSKLKKDYMILSLEIGSDAALNVVLERAYDEGQNVGYDTGYDEALHQAEFKW